MSGTYYVVKPFNNAVIDDGAEIVIQGTYFRSENLAKEHLEKVSASDQQTWVVEEHTVSNIFSAHQGRLI